MERRPGRARAAARSGCDLALARAPEWRGGRRSRVAARRARLWHNQGGAGQVARLPMRGRGLRRSCWLRIQARLSSAVIGRAIP